jgi:IS5 family transposase
LTRKQRQSIADGADFNKTINDYQRKRGDYLPPTRVDSITARAKSRADAVEQLTQAGYLAA